MPFEMNLYHLKWNIEHLRKIHCLLPLIMPKFKAVKRIIKVKQALKCLMMARYAYKIMFLIDVQCPCLSGVFGMSTSILA